MEEPVHFIMLIIQIADGTYVRELLEFSRPMTLMECLGFGDEHREAVTTYVEEENRHIMKDGSGDWYGFGCYQDPEKIN
jgi:hypothetical protein